MQTKFPQYLSAPFQILWFETDDLAFLLLFFVFAMVYSGWFLWSMVVIGPYAYSKLKKAYPRGFLRHCFYFIGLTHMPGYPSFFEQEFTE